MLYKHKDGISFRKIEREDLPFLLDLKQESWWGTHKVLIINSEDQEHWFDHIPPDQLFLLAIWDKVPIGVAVYTEIDWVSRSLNIAGSITEKYRKPELVVPAFSGGLDFAFEVLNMNRVGAEVLDYNRPAQLLEIDHLKFKIEGRKRQAIYRCGYYYDSIVLGLLRSEWENQDRVLNYGGTCNLNFNASLARYSRNRWGATLRLSEESPTS